jgi:hypothetical protein
MFQISHNTSSRFVFDPQPQPTAFQWQQHFINSTSSSFIIRNSSSSAVIFDNIQQRQPAARHLPTLTTATAPPAAADSPAACRLLPTVCRQIPQQSTIIHQ